MYSDDPPPICGARGDANTHSQWCHGVLFADKNDSDTSSVSSYESGAHDSDDDVDAGATSSDSDEISSDEELADYPTSAPKTVKVTSGSGRKKKTVKWTLIKEVREDLRTQSRHEPSLAGVDAGMVDSMTEPDMYVQ